MHIKHEVGQARGGRRGGGVTHLFCAVVGTQSVESVENPHPGGTFPKAAVSLTLQLCLHVDQKAKALPPSTTMGGWQGAVRFTAVLKRPLNLTRGHRLIALV